MDMSAELPRLLDDSTSCVTPLLAAAATKTEVVAKLNVDNPFTYSCVSRVTGQL